MWKSKFVFVLLLTSTIHGNHLLSKISLHLQRVYDYILKNHNEINIDGIFGVVLSQAFLADVNSNNPFVNPKTLEQLTVKGGLIISETIARLETTSQFNKKLIQIAFDPTKWQTQVPFRTGLLDANYTRREIISREDFLRALAHKSFNESFSDKCMLELLKGPEFSTNVCRISSLCRQIMMENSELDDHGYFITHRLLYLQLSKISGCTTNANKTIKYCSKILYETQLIRHFSLIEDLQDLLFEEVTLCGMEGFEEFMQPLFLEAIQILQHDNGCFGFVANDFGGLRAKREANLLPGGCVDHTTGLGASILGLFLKYYSYKLLI